MALLNTKLITPAEASGIVLGAFQETRAQLPFGRILPDQFNPTRLNVSWTPNQPRYEVEDFTYSTWDAEAPYDRTRAGGVVTTTTMLPLRKRHRVSEYDIAAGRIDTEGATAADELRDTFARLGAELAYRTERADLNAITDGVITVDESNLQAQWDYRRDPALTIPQPAEAKRWDAARSDPVKDVREWSDLIWSKEGARPHVMLLTRTVMNALMSNNAVMKYHYNGSAQLDMLPAFIGENEVRNVFANHAQITGMLIVDELYEEFARAQRIILPGGATGFFPQNTIVLLPALDDSGLGFTALGPTAEASQSADYGIARQYDAGPIGVVQNIPGSTPGYEAYVNATMLPVVVQSNSTLKATVL